MDTDESDCKEELSAPDEKDVGQTSAMLKREAEFLEVGVVVRTRQGRTKDEPSTRL